MSPLELLATVAASLTARGHEVACRGVLPGSIGLYVDEQLVARTVPEGVQVTAAEVFDGFKHVVPDGCDTMVVSGSERNTPGRRIVEAIERRMAARAKSPPVPVDPTATVRDPHEHTEDNQGRCHSCGEVLNPGRWADFLGEEVSRAA